MKSLFDVITHKGSALYMKLSLCDERALIVYCSGSPEMNGTICSRSLFVTSVLKC